MPTYDYVCRGCKYEFEHWQTMSSNVLRTCPECKKRKLRRLIGSGAGVIFKGSGFYETDYKRKNRGGGEHSGKDEGSSGGDAKSETTDKKKSDTATASNESSGSSGNSGKSEKSGSAKNDGAKSGGAKKDNGKKGD